MPPGAVDAVGRRWWARTFTDAGLPGRHDLRQRADPVLLEKRVLAELPGQ
jgi:hypothetical protein